MTPVLLVEDNENDIFFTKRAYTSARILNPLLVIDDGASALDYLGARNHYADRARHPLPCLILLDLRLPTVSGFEILSWIRGNPETQELPAVALLSSYQSPDLQTATSLGANSTLVKPPTVSKLLILIAQLNLGCILRKE